MARTAYSVRRNGRKLSVGIPAEVAVSLGIVDLEGNLLTPLVKFDLNSDRSSATITPVNL